MTVYLPETAASLIQQLGAQAVTFHGLGLDLDALDEAVDHAVSEALAKGEITVEQASESLQDAKELVDAYRGLVAAVEAVAAREDARQPTDTPDPAPPDTP